MTNELDNTQPHDIEAHRQVSAERIEEFGRLLAGEQVEQPSGSGDHLDALLRGDDTGLTEQQMIEAAAVRSGVTNADFDASRAVAQQMGIDRADRAIREEAGLPPRPFNLK